MPDDTIYWTSILTGDVGRIDPDGTVTTQYVARGVNPITISDDGRLFTALCFLGDGLYELDPGIMYLAMFDRYLDWRFFMSPTGGGGNALGPGYHNPAWDWSWMVRNPEVGRKYECNIRLVYRKFEQSQDALDEYSEWEHGDSDLLESVGDVPLGPKPLG